MNTQNFKEIMEAKECFVILWGKHDKQYSVYDSEEELKQGIDTIIKEAKLYHKDAGGAVVIRATKLYEIRVVTEIKEQTYF